MSVRTIVKQKYSKAEKFQIDHMFSGENIEIFENILKLVPDWQKI